jgi:hypothetical protein
MMNFSIKRLRKGVFRTSDGERLERCCSRRRPCDFDETETDTLVQLCVGLEAICTVVLLRCCGLVPLGPALPGGVILADPQRDDGVAAREVWRVLRLVGRVLEDGHVSERGWRTTFATDRPGGAATAVTHKLEPRWVLVAKIEQEPHWLRHRHAR